MLSGGTFPWQGAAAGARAVLGWLRPHQGGGLCCTPFPPVPLLGISAQQHSETGLCQGLCVCQRRDALRSQAHTFPWAAVCGHTSKAVTDLISGHDAARIRASPFPPSLLHARALNAPSSTGNGRRSSAKEAASATAGGVLGPCPPGSSLQLFTGEYYY